MNNGLLKNICGSRVVTVAISTWWPLRTLVHGTPRWFRASALENETKKNQPRPAGKLIIADICKGIFVISQAT
jgi:hypothetical protein